jgi:hypothetical protein
MIKIFNIIIIIQISNIICCQNITQSTNIINTDNLDKNIYKFISLILFDNRLFQ